MISSLKNLVYEYRQPIIADLLIPFALNIAFAKDRGRDESTLLALNLHGRLSDANFKTWIESTYGKEHVESSCQNPAWSHFKSQAFTDLTRKMVLPVIIIAAAHFFPHAASFATPLKNLVNCSEIISRAALPVIERLSPVLDIRIIACAPVITKLYLLHFHSDPTTHNQRMYYLAERVTRALEMFSGFAFSICSLSLTDTFYPTLANAAFMLAVPSQLSFLPSLIAQSGHYKNPGYLWIDHVIHSICYFDFWPTKAFNWGVKGVLGAYQLSSQPYSEEKLTQLFTSIDTLQISAETFETQLLEKKQAIKKAQEEGEISDLLASGLNKHLIEKTKTFIRSLTELSDTMPKIIDVLNINLRQEKISEQECNELAATCVESLESHWKQLKNIRSEKFETFLSNPENETKLIKHFGPEGLYHQLTGEEDRISKECCFKIFNLHFNWYIEQAPQIDAAARKECEIALSILARQSFAERTRDSLRPIPEDFNFATYSLPYLAGRIRSALHAPYNTRPQTHHIPDHFVQRYREIPEDPDILNEELGDIENSYPTFQEIRELLS